MSLNSKGLDRTVVTGLGLTTFIRRKIDEIFFFFFFTENRDLTFHADIFIRDNLHVKPNPVFWVCVCVWGGGGGGRRGEIGKKSMKMSSAETFYQSMACIQNIALLCL